MKKNVRRLFFSIVGVVCALSMSAQDEKVAEAQHIILGQNAAGQTAPAPLYENNHPLAQWFPSDGLGLFVHFGLAAIHGGIDLSWAMYANKPWEDGEISPADYWKLADGWEPHAFDADKWVLAAADAGFKYVVFTTKHHDGYTLWNSDYGMLGVKQKMKGRDLVKEVVDACHKHNLKVGLYFSPPDWYYDAQYINWDYSNEKIFDINHREVPKLAEKPQGHDEVRRTMVANQVRELLTKYGRIDLLWFDGGAGEISNEEVRKLQPGIVINRRNTAPGDYGDSEGVLPTKRFSGWFETCDPCWPSRWWSYSTSDRMDSASEVIEKLVLLRAWGGNLLANVGPLPDGSMPKEATEAWKIMGAWTKHSGESVFGTTGGTFPEKANQPTTVKGDIVYMHAFPNMHKDMELKGVERRPKSVTLLRTKDSIPFELKNSLLCIYIPASKRTRFVDTVKIEW